MAGKRKAIKYVVTESGCHECTSHHIGTSGYPCIYKVGGAGVGFGFSVGTSWKDDECGIRETSRSFSGLGLKEDALAVLCTSEYAKAAPACVAREQAQPK